MKHRCQGDLIRAADFDFAQSRRFRRCRNAAAGSKTIPYLPEGRVGLVIAHHLSAIANAAFILAMAEGDITGMSRRWA